jgi:hypothetical protein
VVEFAARADLQDHDRITRETALFGLRVTAHNRLSHAALDDLTEEIHDFAAEQPRRAERVAVPDRARALLEQLAMAGCFAASVQACGGETDSQADGGTAGYTAGHAGTGGYVVDPLIGSGGTTTGGSRGTGGFIVDPLIGSGGRGTGGVNFDGVGGVLGVGGYGSGGRAAGGIPPAFDGTGGVLGVSGTGGRATGGYNTFDTGGAPVIGGQSSGGSATGGIQGDGGVTVGGYSPSGGRATGGMVDSLPSSGGRSTGGYSPVADCVPTAAGTDLPSSAGGDTPPVVDPAPPDRASPRREMAEQWRDTTPRHVTRSRDLPLFDPPVVKLESRVEGDSVEVTVRSDEPNLSVRWECEGVVEGEGCKVSWQPASSDDALCVAVRGPGGIAVASLRARDLPDR